MVLFQLITTVNAINVKRCPCIYTYLLLVCSFKYKNISNFLEVLSFYLSNKSLRRVHKQNKTKLRFNSCHKRVLNLNGK